MSYRPAAVSVPSRNTHTMNLPGDTHIAVHICDSPTKDRGESDSGSAFKCFCAFAVRLAVVWSLLSLLVFGDHSFQRLDRYHCARW
jgi:hypothetical protein